MKSSQDSALQNLTNFLPPSNLLQALEQEKANRQSKESLSAFTRASWKTFEPKEYIHNWHIEAKCDHLMAVNKGQIRGLIINEPPRHMKSLLCGVSWVPWTWIQEPDGPLMGPGVQFLYITYAQKLSTRDSVKCRRLIQSPWFQGAYGNDIRLTSDQNEKQKFENDQFGARIATSFEGGITGDGGDIIVLDDPHNAMEALSDRKRENVIDTWKEAISTRLNDPKTGAFVLIMQRLHEDDLTGHILASELGWDHLCLPAEYEKNHIYPIQSSIGFKDPRTKEGELLWPERFGTDQLEHLKKSLRHKASGQLQQRPQPEDGTFFQREWFKRYTPGEEPNCSLYGTSDYAVTQDGGDFTEHCLWGIAPDDDLYLKNDGWFGQTTSDTWIEKLCDLIIRNQPYAWFGETGVIKRSLEPYMIKRMQERKAYCRLEWLTRTSDKVSQARGFQARAAMGKVWLPDTPYGDRCLEQLLMFPNGKNDDFVDLCSLIGRALDEAHPAMVVEEKRVGKEDKWGDPWGDEDEESIWEDD